MVHLFTLTHMNYWRWLKFSNGTHWVLKTIWFFAPKAFTFTTLVSAHPGGRGFVLEVYYNR